MYSTKFKIVEKKTEIDMEQSPKQPRMHKIKRILIPRWFPHPSWDNPSTTSPSLRRTWVHTSKVTDRRISCKNIDTNVKEPTDECKNDLLEISVE